MELPRRPVLAAEDARERAPARRAGAGLGRAQPARHTVEHGDPRLHEPGQGAAAVRRHRRLKWGNEIEQYPYTIGYQPDYESEGIAYAQYALEQNPDAKIGVLYANDDFGKDYLTGIKEGLGDKADQLVSEVTYETTDATIDTRSARSRTPAPTCSC